MHPAADPAPFRQPEAAAIASRHGMCGVLAKPRPRLLLPILLAVSLLASSAGIAQGQTAVLAQAVIPPPAPAAPALSQAEAKQMMDLLNDPQKRAAFTATLQTLAKASAVVNPPKQAAPLAPDSVGALVLARGSAWVSSLSGQFVAFGHLLGNLPAVWAFTLATIDDPASRAQAFDAGWHLALVLALSIAAELLTWRLLRRLIAAIASRAPGANAPVEPGEPPAIASDLEDADDIDPALDTPVPDVAPVAPEAAKAIRHRRFARTLRSLQRLPFVLLAFVLDLLPLAVFMGVGTAGALLCAPDVRLVLQPALLAYAGCRLATSLTRMVVSPGYPSLRLVRVSDNGATYVLVWVRRLCALGAFGFAATQIGTIFGLPGDAQDAFLKAVFLVIHLGLIVVVLQCRASVAARIRGQRDSGRMGAKVRRRLASIWHLIAIFYIASLWLVWAAEIRHGYLRVWHFFLITCAVLIAARLTGIVLLGGLERAFRLSPETASRYPGLELRANHYVPILRQCVSVLLVSITMLALLQAWGVDTTIWFSKRALGGQLLGTIGTILVAALVAIAIWEAVNAAMDRSLARLTREAQLVKSARLRTLLPILRTVLAFTLIAVFGLTALSQIGVNIGPLLAGAGILGVAIGFGSQKLVQDFITGIFLLLENAMQVGDWVTVAGLSGTVENLSIRTMRLRAGDGSVHIIPFSSVSTVTNVNRGIGNAAVTVSIPIEENSDQVCDVLTDIAKDMRGERRFADMMRSDFQLWGVDRVEAGAVTIAGQIVCTDSGRWAVQREFNRRMTIRFKELGLRIATPVQTVYAHTVSPAPKAVLAQETDAPPKAQILESPPPQALGNTS